MPTGAMLCNFSPMDSRAYQYTCSIKEDCILTNDSLCDVNFGVWNSDSCSIKKWAAYSPMIACVMSILVPEIVTAAPAMVNAKVLLVSSSPTPASTSCRHTLHVDWEAGKLLELKQMQRWMR
jgi:hypothetical protein